VASFASPTEVASGKLLEGEFPSLFNGWCAASNPDDASVGETPDSAIRLWEQFSLPNMLR
jgi:hypothetical protein